MTSVLFVWLLLIFAALVNCNETLKFLRGKTDTTLTRRKTHQHLFKNAFKRHIAADSLQAQAQAIQQLQSKIRNGLPITMVTIGGSNSAGGGLDQAGQIYTDQIASWWNNQVYNKTGSRLESHNMAIGATTSDLFLFCLQNYLPPQSIDIVLIELAANDFGSIYGKAAQPMELLTRRLLLLPSKPLVIYVHFVNPAIVHNHITNTKCTNMQNFGFDDLARNYGIPVFSLKDIVCPGGAEYGRILDDSKIDMFASDGNHVGFKSHAAIAAQIIKYFIKNIVSVTTPNSDPYYSYSHFYKRYWTKRQTTRAGVVSSPWGFKQSQYSSRTGPRAVATVVDKQQLRATTTRIVGSQTIIAKPLFSDPSIKDDQLNDARCFSHLTPDYTAPSHQTLQVKVIESLGFKYQTPFNGRRGSNFRTDAFGGWKAGPGFVKLKMEFAIPSTKSSSSLSMMSSSSFLPYQQQQPLSSIQLSQTDPSLLLLSQASPTSISIPPSLTALPSPLSSSPPTSSSRSIVVLFNFDMNKPLSIQLSLNDHRTSCTQITVSSKGGYKTIYYAFPVATGVLPGNYTLTLQGNVNFLHFLGMAVVYDNFHVFQGFKEFDGILKPC